MKIFVFALPVIIGALSLSACHGPKKFEEAKYWQRASASSALYLRGPKAQQMLHMDIADCTSDIKELHRLGEIRRAIPANYRNENDMEPRTVTDGTLDTWETPERDGYLYGEFLEYHDFETCMTAKGWERAEFLPYTEADLARKNYRDRYFKKKKKTFDGPRENVTTLYPPAQNPAPYEDLNQ